MIRLLRLLQGYVVFVAEGGFIERFLNLCKINNINLWNVKNDGVKVYAFTLSKDFDRINLASERSAMTIKVQQKRGLRYFVTRNKLRVGVVLGLMTSCLLTIYLSGCIWNVDIQEKSGVKAETFANTLEELGVKPGARKSKIDILAVQDELLKRHSELLWASLNIFGGRAELEYTLVNEKTPSPETFLPTNIIAEKKGVVTLVECYRGMPLVKEGQFVAEGSMLISGVVSNADGTESLTQAMGKVYAKTENTVTVTDSSITTGMISGDIEPSYGVFLFGLDIPFGRPARSDFCAVSRFSLTGNKTSLPVGFVRCDCLSFSQSEITADDDMMRLTLLLSAVEEKRRKFDSAKLQSVALAYDNEGISANVTVKVTCVEDIATEKTIYVEEN